MFNWKLAPNLTTEAAMPAELRWRSLTSLMYVHGCLILSNLSAPLSWRNFLRIPSWDLFSWHYAKLISTDLSWKRQDQWWWCRLIFNRLLRKNCQVEWVILWNIHTFTTGFKNTYQTIIDVQCLKWDGTHQYAAGLPAILCCAVYSTRHFSVILAA